MKYADEVDVNCISDNKCVIKVPERNIARIIGKEGKTINELEKRIGMNIDVQALDEKIAPKKGKDSVPYEVVIKKNSILFQVGIKMQHKDFDVYIGEEFILTAKAGKTGLIKIKRNNAIGRMLIKAYNTGEEIKLKV